MLFSPTRKANILANVALRPKFIRMHRKKPTKLSMSIRNLKIQILEKIKEK